MRILEKFEWLLNKTFSKQRVNTELSALSGPIVFEVQEFQLFRDI